jgi:anhydro-N-acetylmuramic acid kinase
MSGTSCDGLDIALCEIELQSRYFENLLSLTIPYPDVLRSKLLSITRSGSTNLHDLVGLSQYLGDFYTDCVERFCGSHGIPLSSIDLIGSHGQTVAHLSQPHHTLGRRLRGTMQIGEPELLAKRLGITTVSDFRSADIAVGGSGAPLVPIYHHRRFSQPGKLTVVVNIGGVANATLLDGTEGILATDCGPGNCLIDDCMQALYGSLFDAGGAVAKSGAVDSRILTVLKQDETLNRTLPRSYDRRELVELADRHHLFAGANQSKKEDVIATISELTVISIIAAVEKLSAGATTHSVLVCGGGALNDYLMTRLSTHYGPSRVKTTSEFGSDPEYVEAEAFAYLANLTLDGETGNLPAVTGAARPVVLGKISQP